MTATRMTITPQDVRAGAVDADVNPRWLEQVVSYVQQAAAAGETVTLTARRSMMTPEEVADALGVSRSTISRRIKAGDIRVVKVGNRNRIPHEEFERYWRSTMSDLVDMVREDLREDLVGNR